MRNGEIELRPEQLLTAIVNQFNSHFFGEPRIDARNRYRHLKRGSEIDFLEMSATDEGIVQCKLALDYSEFVGRLNFQQFRDALASHMQRIEEKLKKEEPLKIFTNEKTGHMIFHIPGVAESDGIVNILVTGFEQQQAGQIVIRLMFLDPQQFLKQN